ncbi:type IV secretion system protein [Kocuria sp. cx-116]|uniref:type IV secretion system protein n=1 Tax=Kocuria sp. cx-116 TaxID=2771378 RepID=UPI001689D681|nr:type IV secretion system protein [Kocuria sp. cx-116]MBD2763582.1 type IV secretion system protein [Kocuria sp. cx-116]
MADEEKCGFLDGICKAKKGVSEALTGAAGDALDQIADGVTAGVVDTVASLGSMWTRIGSAGLTSGGGTGSQTPVRGDFNAYIDTLLGYASWLGLGVAVFGVLFLGIVLAVNARRGDGAGLVNTATVLAGGAALVGGATSLIGFLVPARAMNLSGSVGFIQDQTFYLTLAVAALSVMIAGARMAWFQRAEPARELLKGLLTLAVVTASGVTILNVLIRGTDALAVQIIDSSIGDDFQTDVLKLLALDNMASSGTSPVWLGGNVILIIVGGVVAIIVNLIQVMLMVLRTGMLFLMAGILPLSAAFLNTETGKNFFQKVIAWTLAFAFYKPAAALIYGLAIKMSTTGVWEGDGGLIQFAAGLMMIVASVFALPVLIGFLSPVLGSMSSNGGGGALGVAAMGAAIPQGAAHLSRSGRGFGSDSSASQAPTSTSSPTPAGAGPGSAGTAGGGTGAAGVGAAGTAAAGAAAAPVAVGLAAADAVKKTGEAVGEATASSAGIGTSDTSSTTGPGGAPSGPAPGSTSSAGPTDTKATQVASTGRSSGARPSLGASTPGPTASGGKGTRPSPGPGTGTRTAPGAGGGARPSDPAPGVGPTAKAAQQQVRALKQQIIYETGDEAYPDGANRS